MGLTEVITLLLGLTGFGIQPNPRPATPDAVLAYALPDPDLVVHLDVTSLVPGNLKTLSALADQPTIKASPDLARAMRQLVTEVESARGVAKTMTGVDLATDVSDVTAFFHIVPGHDPDAVVEAHGKFSTATIDKIAGAVHKPATRTKDGGEQVEMPDGKAIAVTHDGVLLAGTSALIAARTGGGWRMPAHGAGTNLAYTAETIAQHPVFSVVFTGAPAAREAALAGHADDHDLFADLMKRHKAAGIAVFHDGIGWFWVDTTKAGLDDFAQMSDGMIDLLRAAQVAPRGFAKIALGALDSYRGKSPQVDAVIARKGDLMKLVDTYTGDGKFKANVSTDPKALRLTVRLVGKTTSEVVPVGVIVPLAAIGAFAARDEAARPQLVAPSPSQVRPAAAPPAPRR